MRPRRFALLAVIACAFGAAAGWFAHGRWQRRALPAPPPRPAALEARLLPAVAAGDAPTLRSFVDGPHPAWIRARAATALARRGAIAPAAWAAHMRAHHPRSWMLRTAAARAGRVPR